MALALLLLLLMTPTKLCWRRRRLHEQVKKPGPGCPAHKVCALACRIDALLEQVDLGSQVLAVDPVHILEDVTVPRRDSRLTAWVNVIFGCNERCTYCVVPNTRGREQSRDPAAIKVGPSLAPLQP